ncbi:hypothetical protein OMP43_17750 [Sphingomonas sp. CBMAI 2297]|uniref:hypothetical protein n=1 Tax=Sphingomonas sp. CBMAI 2297 TaxID=2991720 RepID=UPI002453CDF3|nr:hypothetical protein [Sphingomonas sp. CBMAI 2297]MDH4745873.1 hypothetical protein [Sphingomonas sp. CBMAI 2297]
MSNDDFDAIFSGQSPTPRSFVQRVGRAEPVPAPAPLPEDMPGTSVYKPYGSMPAGGSESCDVQRWLDGTQIAEGIEFQYRFLMQIGYVGDEQIKLFLPDCIVVIEGRFLRDLRKKLARRQVTFIQQYTPLIWGPPPNGDPVIESITVVRPEAAHHRRG